MPSDEKPGLAYQIAAYAFFVAIGPLLWRGLVMRNGHVTRKQIYTALLGTLLWAYAFMWVVQYV